MEILRSLLFVIGFFVIMGVVSIAICEIVPLIMYLFGVR